MFNATTEAQIQMPECNIVGSINFEMMGCSYRIIQDRDRRKRRQPSWYVLRMSDHALTERYYTWPDGAFSAVYWQRCNWTK